MCIKVNKEFSRVRFIGQIGKVYQFTSHFYASLTLFFPVPFGPLIDIWNYVMTPKFDFNFFSDDKV